ncbi:MAG: dihydroorotase [Elusimicrobiota bacterium]
MNNDILLKNGTVVDPVNRVNAKLDVYISGGKVKKVGKSISVPPGDTTTVIDITGKIVIPGLVDMHTHLREPGEEDEETIKSGTRAAAAGGVTTVCCMPNTHPVTDNQAAVEFILLKAKNEGVVNVHPIGAVTKKQEGIEIAEIGELKKVGVVAISDDGHSIMNAQVMRRALEYAKMFGLPLIAHCEDIDLSVDGVMNEGFTSTKLGLKGIPSEAEEVMVSRDLMLAELTTGILHIAHVSTAGSVELIRQAKRRGVKVTAETAPHYFTLTDEIVEKYDANAKMNPPLRTAADVAAIKKGIADGTIDCIASDHAPHTDEEKNKEFGYAPFGIIGLETILPLTITYLVKTKVLSLSDAVKKLAVNPSKILGLNRGNIKPGSVADITVIDINTYRKVDKKFVSQSANSPFVGFNLTGYPVLTIVNGKIVYQYKK